MHHKLRTVFGPAALAVLAIGALGSAHPQGKADSSARYLDRSDGRDWPGYGRTFGQQHYSPLTEINPRSVERLGLAWSMDLGPQNSATQPIAVDGVLYFATGLSVVHAVDARSGKLLWRYDPRAAEQAGRRLRLGWGTRGIAWWNDKVYTGTEDGRLIAIDARRGQPVWSVQTLEAGSEGHLSGAPRVFDGKVIIGYGANSMRPSRGYVTAYDAESGRQLWRFYTVPGNPADGSESAAQLSAAKTWSGAWWTRGGGANVWNAIAYDAEIDTVFIGTGSGFPVRRAERTGDRGDNLFVSSIVALDGQTGGYQWHYQITPGDTWDYDATMDIELADLRINGRMRKVLMQAPKNGFYYVIDRLTGQLISAQPYTKVTWASRIDLATGRPVENRGVRDPEGQTLSVLPHFGGHNWMPMAYSPKTILAYIPVIEEQWPSSPAVARREAKSRTVAMDGPQGTALPEVSGALVAWDPVMQTARWRVAHPTFINSGILATGGDLVFQGTVDGMFKAYSATTGKLLWSFAAQAPLIATPITYAANGKQYVTVLTGLGMGFLTNAGQIVKDVEKYGLDPRSQARRVLTFALDGMATLPKRHQAPLPPPDDRSFRVDEGSARAGQALFAYCAICHGASAVGSIHAPDLRRSAIPLSAEAFSAIVRDGALVPNGMPGFAELTDTQLSDLRQYIRTEAQALRNRSKPR